MHFCIHPVSKALTQSDNRPNLLNLASTHIGWLSYHVIQLCVMLHSCGVPYCVKAYNDYATGLPNGASAPLSVDTSDQREQSTAKVALEDLFKDVWLAEEEEEDLQPAQQAQQAQHPQDKEVTLVQI